MAPIFTPNLPQELTNSYVVIDTCTIIDASKCDEALEFLNQLKSWNCILLSTLGVKNEFTRSANTKKEQQQLSDFIDSLDILLLNQMENKMLDTAGIRFNIGLNRCKNIHPSFVDSTILAIPYFYHDSSEKIYLVTSNFHDVPQEFFDLVGFASYHAGKFHNIGIYQFNLEKFNRITNHL